MNEYHFGWDTAAQEFILWKRGRALPIARIPRANALPLIETLAHVLAVEEASDGTYLTTHESPPAASPK